MRVFLSTDPAALLATSDFLQREFGADIPPEELRGSLERAVFGTPAEADASDFQPLNGRYVVTVQVLMRDPADTVGSVTVALGGTTYGVMGTDSLGRDLAVGLLFGFPVALAIGLATSVLSTAIGTFMGILSGFTAGKTDIAIQRSADVLTNVPLLPILIFLIFILGQKLWLVVVILIAFGWPGLTIVVRSMVLQIRSGQLVEATRSLGASRWRIMFRHILFQISPYVFAQMIFFTPAAILAEAGLSFLGLGDPSIPTWGQILASGFRTGAVYVGYWWWVLPPGLLIVVTAMTFVLLTLGLEPLVNPRLRATR
jgi:peptide/nickel transport system permease protein